MLYAGGVNPINMSYAIKIGFQISVVVRCVQKINQSIVKQLPNLLKKTKREREREILLDKNLVIHGDNLDIIGSIPEDSIDLIYIDPPFLSNADYVGFTDKWDSGEEFLSFLIDRLWLMKDVLKPTGLIYLHLDWHMSHYARVILDEIFGQENFVNEIIWTYGLGGSSKKYWPRKHDNIFVYSKTKNYYHNPVWIPAKFKGSKEGNLKKLGSVWDITLSNTHPERTGYGTQKPEKLLLNIIEGSCPEDGIVADFFCGSGTTAAVAHKMGRQFVVCDKGEKSIEITRNRLDKIKSKYDFLTL